MKMDKEEIKKHLPHRDPFLFLDEVLELEEKRICTVKRVKSDEDFFKGHYPGNPIMPGVLICECVFQAAALLISTKISYSGNNQKAGTPVLTRIKSAKFKGMVIPGDELRIEVELMDQVSNAWYLRANVFKEQSKILFIEFAVSLVAYKD